MAATDRAAALERAGWNVLHLDAFDIPFDLLTDVPPRSFVTEVAEAGAAASLAPARDPDLAAIAEALYGPARYVVTTKGRAAEAALLSSLGQELTVVTHGLFRSTQHAIGKYAKGPIELAPIAREGSADLDLEWLRTRLARGGVGAVYLEPSNNGLAGWPLSLEHVRAVRVLCKQAGTLLFLDCCRLLSNVLALGHSLAVAREFCAAADAFTVSCSKELLTPYGAFVGVRDQALEWKVQMYCADEGTLLEPVDSRVRLAAGMQRILDDPAPLTSRHALVQRLATKLRELGVPIVEPVGVHAVFVRVPFAPSEPLRARGLEAQLYLDHGVRAIAVPNPLMKATLMRLPLVVAAWDEARVDRLASAIASALTSTHLTLEAAEPGPNPMLGRYRRR